MSGARFDPRADRRHVPRKGFGRAAMAIAVILSGQAGAAEPATIRTLLLSGGSGHDWRASSAAYGQILGEAGRFDVRVSETPAAPTSAMLADFDLVVDDRSGAGADVAIADFVASGKGLLVTHGALGTCRATGSDPAPSHRLIAAKVGPHPSVGFLDVKPGRAEHPITRGMKGGFRTADALPLGLVVEGPAEVVALASDGSGKEIPALIAASSGKGRIAWVALGHDASAIHEPGFRAAFARAAEWAATSQVVEQARPEPAQLKGLLVTGGHDHLADFYGLFGGYEELARLPVLTSAEAFRADIRGKYDVVIMYDFTRDMDEASRKHLRDYVEGGGGVVVLHHALLNNQTWDWWDDEAVGGSYRLSRPSSAVKDDQQIDVTPAGDHPITSGLAPFHIRDEAYKNLRMSPKIRPLLTTDNPTSDRNLAWVGPLEGSRVVAIQLGHGPSAFGHPSYRALVRNAVVWAAGKAR